MSLTVDDLKEIRIIIREEVRPIIREEVRPIVREEVRAEVDTRLRPVEGRLEAVENDVKDIYFMVADLQVAVAGKP